MRPCAPVIQPQRPCPPPRTHTGKEQSIRIQSSGGLSEDQIQNMVREAEQYGAADKKRKEMIEVGRCGCRCCAG